MQALLLHCVGLVTVLCRSCYSTVSALLLYCVGLVTALCRPCYCTVLALLLHCVGLVTALCWPCYCTVSALLLHCVGLVTALCRPCSLRGTLALKVKQKVGSKLQLANLKWKHKTFAVVFVLNVCYLTQKWKRHFDCNTTSLTYKAIRISMRQ